MHKNLVWILPVIQNCNIWWSSFQNWMNLSREEVYMTLPGNPLPGLSKRVLTNFNNISVLQHFNELWSNGSEVIWHYERCGKNNPERHLSLGLFIGETKVANDQHVGIIPTSWSSKLQKFVFVVTIVVNYTLKRNHNKYNPFNNMEFDSCKRFP